MRSLIIWCFGLLVLILALSLGGCVTAELAEAGIAEEGIALSASDAAIDTYALEESLISTSDKKLLAMEESDYIGGTVTPEMALTELENVRLVETGEGKPPQLEFTYQNSRPFAEILDKRTIRFLDGRGEINMHHDIYAIKGDYVPARTSWIANEQHANRILSNKNMRLVLKLEEKGGYYRVLISRNEECWLQVAFLIPVIIAGDNYKKETVMNKYPNGIVKEKYQLLDGKIDGVYSSYYDNGKLYTSRDYSYGRLKEVWGSYTRDGRHTDKGDFAQGNGTVKVYDQNGNLSEIQTYHQGLLVKTSGISQNMTTPAKIQSSTIPTSRTSFSITNDNYPSTNNAQVENGVSSSVPPKPIYRQSYGNYTRPTTFSGNVEFHGIAVGAQITIDPNSNFIISKGAIVKGNVILGHNSSLQINGKMEGDVYNYGGHVYGSFVGHIYIK